ncbi:MAG TPA: gliding motility-associated C-terminal domain-containing protein [Bacteroidia bacterium]|nr:gliding motility-associated C-terminal domain-containing protein [Bacteroidia bacterium]
MLRKLLSIAFLFSGPLAFAQAPTAAIISPSGTICTREAVIFNSTTTNTPTAYSWTISPATGVNYVSSTLQPSVGVSFSFAGVYSVSLTVSNASGTVTTTNIVIANVNPNSSFSASLTTVGFPNQIDLTNFSTGATSYIWGYSETVMTNTTTNAVHDYTAAGAYTVTLIALNSDGCFNSSSYSFYIADSSGITLPNIFTPNGDGVNDIFKPVARGINSMKVYVYTRYGNFLYSWDTINGFWDGYTTSGILCESGTYFYVIEATGFDGKNYKLNSYLTLLRN